MQTDLFYYNPFYTRVLYLRREARVSSNHTRRNEFRIIVNAGQLNECFLIQNFEDFGIAFKNGKSLFSHESIIQMKTLNLECWINLLLLSTTRWTVTTFEIVIFALPLLDTYRLINNFINYTSSSQTLLGIYNPVAKCVSINVSIHQNLFLY